MRGTCPRGLCAAHPVLGGKKEEEEDEEKEELKKKKKKKVASSWVLREMEMDLGGVGRWHDYDQNALFFHLKTLR